MKRWIAGLFLFMPAFAAAQLSYTYDLKSHRADPALIMATGLKIERPLGLPLALDVVSIAGARQESGALFGGFGLTMPLRVAKNLWADIGAFVKFEQSKPVGGGFLLSFRM